MRSPKRVSLLLRISRVGFPQTTTCVVVARVASKYLRMSYAGPVSLVLIVCWSCLKLSITDWNSDAMIMDFEKNCYHSPHTTTTRRLENANNRSTPSSRAHFGLRTTNSGSGSKRIIHWSNQIRYGDTNGLRAQHRSNSGERSLARSSALLKVHRMASDAETLHQSAVQKLAEFARLGYPRGLLRQQCSKMATMQRTYEWIRVRDNVMTWFRDLD